MEKKWEYVDSGQHKDKFECKYVFVTGLQFEARMVAMGCSGERAHLKGIPATTNPPVHRPGSHSHAWALVFLLRLRKYFLLFICLIQSATACPFLHIFVAY